MSGSNSNAWIVLRGASGNNLRAIDVAIPRGLFTCVTGVSGSGKSTLVQDTLFPRLMYEVYGTRTTWAAHDSLCQAIRSATMGTPCRTERLCDC